MWFLLIPGILLFASLAGLAFSIYSIVTPFHISLQEPLYLGLAPLSFASDSAGCIFLLLLCALTVAFSILSPTYLAGKSSSEQFLFWTCSLIFIASMSGVIFSSNAILFLVCWELMSLSSAALVASELLTKNTARASLIYLSATKIATTFIVSGFLFAHNLFHSWNFADWQLTRSDALVPALLIAIGCLVKSGIWPFHIWLPYAYPAAPAPVAGLMSGIMIKIPIFVLINLLICKEQSSLWIPVLLLSLGSISTLWGMIFALVQTDLKKILAYSSVENIGLIMVALGACQLSRFFHQESLASLFLTAAIFHILNHGIFKSLLFFGVGAIYQKTHSSNLQDLGGLAKKMPGTFLFFLLGILALCSLPPSNGFCSKWLIYQGLFQFVTSFNIVISFSAILIICVLIIAGALSLANMTKVVAVVFLGRPRTRLAQNATECSEWMLASQGILACICIFQGLFAPQVCKFLTGSLSLIDFSCIDLFKFSVFGIIVLICIYISFLKQSGRSKIYSTWECGFGPLTGRMQLTSQSFAQPIANLFGILLRYKITAEVSGVDRRHFPDKVVAESSSQSLLEARVYTPLVRLVTWLGAHINRLQAGSIHIYLFYLLITLIVLIVLELVR